MLPSALQRLLGPQLVKMQEKANQVAQELREMRLEGQAGGGSVRALVSGSGELQEVNIDPDLLNPEELELLQDLIVVAIRDAMKKAEEVQQQKAREILRGFPLGGLLGLGR